MTLAAGPWYTSATFSTVLSAAGVLAAVVIAVVTTKLLRRPLRRSLQYATEVQPLVGGPQEMREPYLVTFSLANRSRADIRRDDFDGEEPVAFDFGTRVMLLGSARPGNEDRARFRVEGDSVKVGPALIRHGETLSLRLLTSKPPAVRVDQNSLAEVSLREKRGGYWRTAVTIPLIGVLLVATTLASGLVSHYLTSAGSRTASASLPTLRFVQAKAQDVCQIYHGTGTIPAGYNLIIFENSKDTSYYMEGLAANQRGGGWDSPLVMAANDPTFFSAVLVPTATGNLLTNIFLY